MKPIATLRAAALLLLIGLPGEAAAQMPQAMPVPVTPVVKQSVPLYLSYPGTVEAIRSVALQTKITGYLAERTVEDGSDVNKGDLLYRIDPRDYAAALAQARAQAQRDAAALDYSRVSQQRSATLTREGWATKDNADQTASALKQAQATLAADQAAVQVAENNLSYTEIRAPFAGRIGRSLVQEGALISAAGTQLTTLVQLDPIYATFNPPETDLAKIEMARAAGVLFADLLIGKETEPRFSGSITFLDNVVDRATGTIIARATVKNPEKSLLPGQYVRVRLHVGDRPDALLVPQAALLSSQLGKSVYVVGAGNKVEPRLLTLGPTVGPLIVVEKGLAEGDTVITGNLQKIGPGMTVQPLPKTGQTGS
jgi:multidrug efflux system membrane fusion protein